MKYWIMRMPDPGPFGETRLLPIVRAICSADPVNVRDGGKVDAVVTVLTHRVPARAFVTVSSSRAARGDAGLTRRRCPSVTRGV
jgi:hypothetical protein